MKHTRIMAAILFVFGVMAASAQSLGDYARENRTTKSTGQATTNHHYDNDNLPRDTKLSVVGAAPAASNEAAKTETTSSADASRPSGVSTTAADGTKAPVAGAGAETKNPKESKTPADNGKKANEELQTKITAQQQKIESLNRELDLTQREYKLRAATFYSDAGERLRNAAQWDKDDANYKQQIEDKQKALDSAKSQMETLQEEARKAGIRQKDDRQKDDQ